MVSFPTKFSSGIQTLRRIWMGASPNVSIRSTQFPDQNDDVYLIASNCLKKTHLYICNFQFVFHLFSAKE